MRRVSKAIVMACMLAPMAAVAEEGRPFVEASMLVEGKLTLNPDGSISHLTLKQPEKLPAPVVDLINRNLPQWKFTFTRPLATAVEESMSLRVVATDIDAKRTTLRIVSTQFEEASQPENESVQWKFRVPPAFPARSAEGRMSGTVYVLVRVGRDGKVMDAAAEQVNLYRTAEPYMLRIYRNDLAKAALNAAKHWTFTVPTAGASAQAPYWYVRVPCQFTVPSDNAYTGNAYGTWEIYLRGPRETIPWAQDQQLLAESPDAIPDGALHQVGRGPELTMPTPPN